MEIIGLVSEHSKPKIEAVTGREMKYSWKNLAPCGPDPLLKHPRMLQNALPVKPEYPPVNSIIHENTLKLSKSGGTISSGLASSTSTHLSVCGSG